jgi:DNA-binding MarR family transcriptional regulator
MSNDPPLFNFFLEISIIDQLVGTMLERVLPVGITRAQFGILNHFVRLEIDQKSPGELASTFQVTRGTMTRLVTIDTDPADGRGKIVRLTNHGKKLREDCVSAIKPMIAHMAPKFPLDRMPSAMMVLCEVRDILDANRAESSPSNRKS